MKLKTFYQLPVNNIQEARHYGLVKGIAISEGKTKRGEIYTRENIIAGAGALRGNALQGKAILTIDHNKEVPEGIGGNYPFRIIDAQHVNNEGLEQVEFIASIHNPIVYNMVKEGKFKGVSVEDSLRDKSCSHNECKVEGSAFQSSTLTLNGTPNSEHTVIEVITEEDMDHIINPPTLHSLEQVEEPRESGTENKETAQEKEEPKESQEKPITTKDILLAIQELNDKVDSIKLQPQVEKHNHTQHEINQLEQELKNYTVVLNNKDHTRYLEIKSRLDQLLKKKE